MKERFKVKLTERLKIMISNEIINLLKDTNFQELTIGEIKLLIINNSIDIIGFSPCKDDLFDILSKILKGLN